MARLAAEVTDTSVLPWTTYTSQHAVTRALRLHLKPGATVSQVQEFAQAQGMDVSRLHGNVVYASAPASGADRALAAEWLVQFRFGDNHRLEAFVVREGVLGP